MMCYQECTKETTPFVPSIRVSDLVSHLENRLRASEDLLGSILSTLQLNKNHFLIAPGQEEMKKTFEGLLKDWQQKYESEGPG